MTMLCTLVLVASASFLAYLFGKAKGHEESMDENCRLKADVKDLTRTLARLYGRVK